MMEAYSFAQFGGSRGVVHVALYTNVTNGVDVRKKISQGVSFGYIDGRLVGVP